MAVTASRSGELSSPRSKTTHSKSDASCRGSSCSSRSVSSPNDCLNTLSREPRNRLWWSALSRLSSRRLPGRCNGTNRRLASAKLGEIFFPQAKALGVDVDQELSPRLLKHVALVGEMLKSFPQAASAIDQLLGMSLGRLRIERVTERIGAERVAQRDRQTQRVVELKLSEKIHGP